MLGRIGLAAPLIYVSAFAQPVITTVAGTDFVFDGDGKPAATAQLGVLYSVAADTEGNVYTGDAENRLVYRIAPDGTLRVIGGNGIPNETGDGGPATQASFAAPLYVAAAPDGVYIADAVSSSVRRIAPDGVVTNVLSKLHPAGVTCLAVDPSGNVYVCQANSIWEIHTDGSVIVLGNGSSTFSGDGGPALFAGMRPGAIAFDGAGSMFIVDKGSARIRKVDANGYISTIAGGGTSSAAVAPADQALLVAPTGVALDARGTLYIADGGTSTIRALGPDQMLRTIAGSGVHGFSGDGGPAIAASFGTNLNLSVDPAGNIYVADGDNLRVRRIGLEGTVQTIGGTGQARLKGDGGKAVSASFGNVLGLAIDPAGNIFVSDTPNNRIRRIGVDGTISTVAGTGASGDTGDEGPASQATLLGPEALAADNAGNLLIAEPSPGARRIRRLSPDGTIHAAVGKPGGAPPQRFGFPISATELQLGMPYSLTTSPSGDLYFLDFGFTNSLFHVSPDGVVRASVPCVSQAARCPPVAIQDIFVIPTKAMVVAHSHVVLANDGSFYVSDPTITGGVNRIAPNGTVCPVVVPVFAGARNVFCGSPAILPLQFPTGALTFDPSGSLVFANNFSVTRLKTNQLVATPVAGAETPAVNGFVGDGGPANSAGLFAAAMQYDAAGNLFIADSLNRRIREVLAQPPLVSSQPASLSFTARSRGAPSLPQSIGITAEIPGIAFQATAKTNDGAAWLQLAVNSGVTPRLLDVTVDPAALAPGDYTATVSIATPTASPVSASIPVNLHVDAPLPAQAVVDKQSVSFPFARRESARSRTLVVSNAGSGTLSFSVKAEVLSGGNWLSVTAATNTATPTSAAAVTATADPGALAVGTYRGVVHIQPAAGPDMPIPVTMTISALDQAISLSQTGLTFTVVSGGGVTPSRQFEVINIGVGAVDWTATTSTLAGGPGWLELDRSGGTSIADAIPPTVSVSVNASSLAAGVYYGLIRVNAPGSANTPQAVSVFLNVLPAGSDPGASTDVPELLFTSVAGGPSPSSQSFLVYNVSASPKTYRASATFQGGPRQLAVLPADATLDPQQPTRVVVQPILSAADAAGVYSGTVDLQFDDGRVRSVKVRLIVVPPSATASQPQARRRSGRKRRPADPDTGCAPIALIPAFLSLSPSAIVTAGWPVPIAVNVKDDCGAPHTSGSVNVKFSTGDPPLSLQSLGDGRWAATWVGAGARSLQATVQASASDPDLQITGETTVTLGLNQPEAQPSFSADAVVSAAGAPPFTPLAPGSLITISGDRLAEASQDAGSPPYPTSLGNAQVIIGGTAAPLVSVSERSITAVVPFGIGINTTQQIIVERGATYSNTVSVDMAPAQPAIFADSVSTSAKRGQVLLIDCAGLGPTTPQVSDGAAAQADPPASTVAPITVSFGNIDAPADSAALVPGSVGRYRVRVTVPAAAPTGDRVPVRIAALGQISPTVMIPIQ